MGKKRINPLSQITQKIAGTLKEIVESPPDIEHQDKEDEEIESVQEKKEAELLDETEHESTEKEDEIDLEEKEFEEYKREREKRREEYRNEILDTLNSATTRWKETGEVGIHLEPPVPLMEKAKAIWLSMSAKATIATKLKDKIEEVVESAAHKIKSIELSGKKPNTEQVIKEEWKAVLEKMGDADTQDRDEIEDLYSQLSK